MALQNYKRSTDDQRLLQDKNVEVSVVFYPPHFPNQGDLDVGDSDPEKVGAIATFKSGGETKAAVYQGGDTWVVLGEGGSGGATIIQNNSLNYGESSSSMNVMYPSMPIGGMAFSSTNSVQYTKLTATTWKVEVIETI